MDFSLFYLPTYRAGFASSLHAFYEEMTDSVRLADRIGWARVLTTEHHFHYYGGAVPNPAVILAAWARETARIRLAAGVSLVPLRHPLQVAEDYTLVDHLSNGRFDMGISRGFVPHEFDAFGIDRGETADRVTEALEIISRFWRGEPFAYEGRFHSFPRIEPWPVPLQRSIPLWIAASNDRSSFVRVGSGGYRLMMNQYPMSVPTLLEKHSWFKEAYAAAGHDPAARRSGVALMTHIADTEEQAIAEAAPALQEHAGAFRNLMAHQEWDRNYAADESVLMAMSDGGSLRDMFRNRTLIGTPEQAAERLARYRDAGFTEAIFMCRFGNLSAEQCARTMKRLTDEVGPMIGRPAAG
jgi:natural product biosynthesis luciferase-like monooxygenase protein